MKTKIKCFVCDTQYQDNNANDPNHAIYLGYLERRNKYVDTHVFVHNNPQCISKAKKQGILDKGNSYNKCIVCSHRINLSEKTLKDGSKIFQNGYLVDTNHWVHLPFRSTPSLSKFIVSNCYEKAFVHTIYPPDDILLKREEILKKFAKNINQPNHEEEKNKKITKKVDLKKSIENKKTPPFEITNNLQDIDKLETSIKSERTFKNSINEKSTVNKDGKRWGLADYVSIIFLPIMAFGLFAKWFFLLPFFMMDEYGDNPWFWPATIIYFIIMFLLLTFIFEMRGNNYY